MLKYNPVALLYDHYCQIYSLTVYEMHVVKGHKTFEQMHCASTFVTYLYTETKNEMSASK